MATRLQQLRFERGLTVRALARASGLHPSTVSRLETGARRLRIDHIEALAGALGVAPAALLAARPEPARDGRLWEPIGPERPDGARVYRVTIPAGDPQLHSHEGFQWLFVLDGTLRVHLEERDFQLQPGQAFQFDTWRPHALTGSAEVLAIFRREPLVTLTAGSPAESGAGSPDRPR
jgi:transcriptional regulator with XRE-family HTH domain